MANILTTEALLVDFEKLQEKLRILHMLMPKKIMIFSIFQKVFHFLSSK